MTPEAAPGSGPMIVLIGGSMTLDDGSVLDSRQPVDGDPAGRVARTTLATSLLWWQTVITLVSPVLDNAGEGSFALVIGSRSVAELRQDGTLRRTGLRSLLPGGSTTVTVARARDGEAFEDGYEVVPSPAWWHGNDRVGVKRGDSGRRWWFFNGNEFWLGHAGTTIRPAVIIDTGDAALFGFETFEQRRLFSNDLVLVMPHTDHASKYVSGYHDWLQAGRPPQAWPDPQPRDPDAPPDPVSYARPVPVQEDFAVTAIAQAGTWQDPSHLEAARSLLAARFDLKLGIWDLVRNPLLRRTLLNAQPVTTAPGNTAPVPAGAARRASQRVDQKLQDRAAQDAVAEQLGQLRAVGWQDASRGVFRLPLTGSFSRWEGDEPEPLAFLTLAIIKRQASVYPWAAYYNHPDGDAADYVARHQELLQLIAAPGELVLRRAQPIIWREPGGWADDIDWPAWAARLAQRTTAWADAFQDLCSVTLEIHNGTRPYPPRRPNPDQGSSR